MVVRPAILLAAIFTVIAGKVMACGPFFPNNLLDAGDQAVLQAPVADFGQELERMKLVKARTHAVSRAKGQEYYEQASELEMNDLAAALKREGMPDAEATVIMQAHLAERMKLNAYLAAAKIGSQSNFPAVAATPGLPREFADYFEGAIAWQESHGWTATESWERVLQLPPAERHFKSTWAAFMLARYEDSLTNDFSDDEAMKHYEEVRTLAKAGFADSAGLAITSLGGEARIFLHRKNYERAIELYLEQFAAGDDTALDSLRFAAARATGEMGADAGTFKNLAANPRTRGVITAYLISRNPYTDPHEAETDPDAKLFFDRTTAWLEAVEAAKVKDVDSAGQFALAAYQASQMDVAQRWVNRAGNEPVAQWLQAKLDMRAGDIAGAAKLLAKLSRKFPPEVPATNTPARFAQSLSITVNPSWNETIPVGRQVYGELGVLHLARREYAEALDALLRSGYWMDAAYVAERVLTVEELKTYVDRNWPALTAGKAREKDAELEPLTGFTTQMTTRAQIRYLLARRLARAGQEAAARGYYPAEWQSSFDTLNALLKTGHDQSVAAEQRAAALYAAAWITRTNGMELLGTEMEPDWFIYGGDYEGGVSAATRTNAYAKYFKPGADELKRAAQHGVEPEERFHYRYLAADLACEAAQLMPDNSNETAQVLCTAGSWIKNSDPKQADPIYKALVRRCGKTAIGRQADRMRWFPVLDDLGNPLPYQPAAKLLPAGLQLDSIRMMDPLNGWAKSSRAVFGKDDWEFAGQAVLRTTNGGETWACNLYGGKDEEMSATFYDAQTACVAAVFDESTNVTILRTADGGNSWVHADLAQASDVQDCCLSYVDTREGWAYPGWLMVIPDHGMNSSPGDLYRTGDGDENWQLVNSTRKDPHMEDNSEQATEPDFADLHPYLACGGPILFQDTMNGWLLGSLVSTTPRFLFATVDGGQTWQVQTLPLPPSLQDGPIEPAELPHFFPMDGTNGIMGATYCPTNDSAATNFCTVIYATQDSGKTWQPGAPVRFNGVWNFISPQTGWMWSPEPHNSNSTVPVKGTLYRTDDGGGTWQAVPVEKGLENYLTHGEDIVQLDFVDGVCGWAIARDWRNVSQLLQTFDGGRTWNAVQMKVER